MQSLVTTARWKDQKGSKGTAENESVSILRSGLSLFRLLYVFDLISFSYYPKPVVVEQQS